MIPDNNFGSGYSNKETQARNNHVTKDFMASSKANVSRRMLELARISFPPLCAEIRTRQTGRLHLRGNDRNTPCAVQSRAGLITSRNLSCEVCFSKVRNYSRLIEVKSSKGSTTLVTEIPDSILRFSSTSKWGMYLVFLWTWSSRVSAEYRPKVNSDIVNLNNWHLRLLLRSQVIFCRGLSCEVLRRRKWNTYVVGRECILWLPEKALSRYWSPMRSVVPPSTPI